MKALLLILLAATGVRDLPKEYQSFLEHDAYFLIQKEEREIFLKLQDDAQRDLFIQEFWRRRDPYPDTSRNEFKESYLSRLEEAEEDWNFHDPRTRFYALFGYPSKLHMIDCPNLYQPLQVWYYNRIEAIKGEAWLLFYQPYGMGPFKLWEGGSMAEFTTQEGFGDICLEKTYVNRAISWTNFAVNSGDFRTLLAPPVVDLEGVEDIIRHSTYLEPGIKNLKFKVELDYLPTSGPKVILKGNLLVTSEDFASIDVVGELLRGKTFVDRFHYRYQYPEHKDKTILPAEFRRPLYPGDYQLRIKVTTPDNSQGGRYIEEIHVPSIGGDAPVQTFTMPDLSEVFKLSGPDTDRAVTGFQVFSVPALPGLKKVTFSLDSKPVLTCNRPPFSVELNLGDVPLPHVISAEAFDDNGRRINRDATYINAGIDRTAINIITPAHGDSAQPDTQFRAKVVVPENEKVKVVRVYLNDTLMSEIFQEPWEMTLHPLMYGITVVRTELETESGKTDEDTVMLNATSFGEVVRVNYVNLYITVSDSQGKPVLDLGKGDFKVLENGLEQPIEKISLAEKIPLKIAVVLDTSGSMEENIPDVQKAAETFLNTVMKDGDKSLVVDFDTRPRLITPLTDNMDLLRGGLTSLVADGSTALYDSIIFSLYHLQGKGRKAIILLSDGKDTSSRYTFDKVLDYAERAGVIIYPVALKVRFTDLVVRNKLIRLAKATGGRFVSVDDERDLIHVYEDFAHELRSQYHLKYTSTNTGNEFRTIEVEVPGPLSARTIAGYYP